jgi:hypothetical protein
LVTNLMSIVLAHVFSYLEFDLTLGLISSV